MAASEYAGYHQRLAEILMRHMLPGSTLCDLGCGIGLIDFALADHLQHITCVDISVEALGLLKAEASRRHIANITAIKADAAAIQGAWDYGLMLFFHGKFSDHPGHYMGLLRRRLFYIVHADPIAPNDDAKPERTKCSSVSAIREELEQAGIPYQLEHHALEYGQPFASFEEAVDFAKTYRLCRDGEEAAFLKARLQQIGGKQADYQYYLPHTKRFGMFIIEKEEDRAVADGRA